MVKVNINTQYSLNWGMKIYFPLCPLSLVSGRSDLTFSYRAAEATHRQSQRAARQQQLVRRENYSQAHIADAWQGGATAVLQ